MEIISQKLGSIKLLEKLPTDNDAYKTLYRQLRTPLLAALDTYRSHVGYDLTESQVERLQVETWYGQLLNLDARAMRGIPYKVKYYIDKKYRAWYGLEE